MLTAEKDIESLIMMSRINQLVVKVLLRSHQHLSVKFFQRYVLKGLGRDEEENDAEKRSQRLLGLSDWTLVIWRTCWLWEGVPQLKSSRAPKRPQNHEKP